MKSNGTRIWQDRSVNEARERELFELNDVGVLHSKIPEEKKTKFTLAILVVDDDDDFPFMPETRKKWRKIEEKKQPNEKN